MPLVSEDPATCELPDLKLVGTCTFAWEGTYHFFCEAHAEMTPRPPGRGARRAVPRAGVVQSTEIDPGAIGCCHPAVLVEGDVAA